MQVVVGYPPNREAIERKFGPLPHGVIFAWGATIFNPHNITMTKRLVVHEAVHEEQQDGDPETWWAQYLADDWFRLQQELEAHRKEYWVGCRGVGTGERERHLDGISERLASALYGRLIDADHARRLILNGGTIVRPVLQGPGIVNTSAQ